MIGRAHRAGQKPSDAAADKDALAGLARWPVTISYFDKIGKKPTSNPATDADLRLSFEMYENGISRAFRSTTATSSSTAK